MNRTHSLRCAIALIAAASLLGGCSWFRHNSNYYEKAKQTQPLEVPPDLDAPVSSDELSIPQPGSAGSAAQPAAASVGSAPPAAAISGGSLHVADNVDHAWQRVGLALERSQAGTISARDATAHTYTVEVAGLRAPAQPAAPAEHHWYTRILHPFGGGARSTSADTGPVSGNLTVTVSADGDGARVEVNGPEEAARRVLEILRERLS
ncbi:MAG: hypothetical protein JSS28_03220 [Proteobacteria bacterium]|nr:hypothetical protein [Pseudomonadota bacterium]